MNKIRILFIALLLLLLVLASCTNDVKRDTTFTLSLSMDSTAKAISAEVTGPSEATWYATLIQANGSGFVSYGGVTRTNGEPFEVTGTSSLLELSYGEWDLHVEGKSNSNVVYTSTTSSGNDIRLKVTSSGVSILQSALGATFASQNLKVTVRNTTNGKVTVSKGTITGIPDGCTLKWYWSDDYENFIPWTGETLQLEAGNNYWVKVAAVTNDASETLKATGTTEVFHPFDGEAVSIAGGLTSLD